MAHCTMGSRWFVPMGLRIQSHRNNYIIITPTSFPSLHAMPPRGNGGSQRIVVNHGHIEHSFIPSQNTITIRFPPMDLLFLSLHCSFILFLLRLCLLILRVFPSILFLLFNDSVNLFLIQLLNQSGNLGASQMQKRFDVHVVCSQNDFKNSLFIKGINPCGIPFITDNLCHVNGSDGTWQWIRLFPLVVPM